MTASRAARLLALAAGACAAIFAVAVIGLEAPGGPRSELVADHPARQGWKTVEYRGVQIDVPTDWERSDVSDCEFQFPHWGPPTSLPCDFAGGAALYRSATFDPAHGPGVRRTAAKGTDAAAWSGYAYSGDFAVYASSADRDVVQGVLDSVRVTGSKAPGAR